MIRDVVDIVQRAGVLVQETRAALSEGILVRDRDIVAGAQRAADRFLRRRLRSLHRGDTWVVDPLGGGIEFAQWRPQYTIGVALVRGDVPILSVVHTPATGETFHAEVGGGAWDANGRRLHVTDSSAEATVDSPDSIAYAMAQVAAGRAGVALADDVVHMSSVSAGALLVQESGGIVTDISGAPLRFGQSVTHAHGVIAGTLPAVTRASLTLNRASSPQLRSTRAIEGVRHV